MSKSLKRILESDIYRYYGAKKMPIFHKLLPYNISLKYIILYRKANFFLKKGKFYKIIYFYYFYKLKKLSYKTGIQIHPATNINEGFYIGHMGTTVINPKSKIGKNVSLSQGVTIGADVRGKRMGCPEIGNEVFIGANAVIVGKIKVGNNVVIAPNAFVNVDVPDNSVVLGNPCMIRNKENPTEGFIVYKI